MSSPQGDENLCFAVFGLLRLNIAIYPREGTETYHTRGKRSSGNIAIYPRKGTETVSRKFRNNQTHTLQFIPARGQKAPLPLAFASSGGALLFLIFYFTGWELRLPESSL